MRIKRLAAASAAALLPLLSLADGPASAAPLTLGGSTELTVGSNDGSSRGTSRTSRGSRSTRVNPKILVAGANDNTRVDHPLRCDN